MKKIFATLTFALAAAAATPALAASDLPQKVQFTHEGVTYFYTKTKVGESTIYKGIARPGQSFYLVERKGHVTGTANGIRVAFSTPTTTTVDLASAASARSLTLTLR